MMMLDNSKLERLNLNEQLDESKNYLYHCVCHMQQSTISGTGGHLTQCAHGRDSAA